MRGAEDPNTKGPLADRHLVERIARGDQHALACLLGRHGERIYRYALRLMQDPERAEETANDVALELWQSASTFRGDAKVTTWLLGITRNKAFNAMRGKQLVSYVPDAGEAIEDETSEITRLVGLDERRRVRLVLMEAIRRLSTEHRDVLELTFFHECSYQEIAHIVGCPPATVRTRMHYAKRALARVLENLPDAGQALMCCR